MSIEHTRSQTSPLSNGDTPTENEQVTLTDRGVVAFNEWLDLLAAKELKRVGDGNDDIRVAMNAFREQLIKYLQERTAKATSLSKADLTKHFVSFQEDFAAGRLNNVRIIRSNGISLLVCPSVPRGLHSTARFALLGACYVWFQQKLQDMFDDCAAIESDEIADKYQATQKEDEHKHYPTKGGSKRYAFDYLSILQEQSTLPPNSLLIDTHSLKAAGLRVFFVREMIAKYPYRSTSQLAVLANKDFKTITETESAFRAFKPELINTVPAFTRQEVEEATCLDIRPVLDDMKKGAYDYGKTYLCSSPFSPYIESINFVVSPDCNGGYQNPEYDVIVSPSKDQGPMLVCNHIPAAARFLAHLVGGDCSPEYTGSGDARIRVASKGQLKSFIKIAARIELLSAKDAAELVKLLGLENTSADELDIYSHQTPELAEITNGSSNLLAVTRRTVPNRGRIETELCLYFGCRPYKLENSLERILQATIQSRFKAEDQSELAGMGSAFPPLTDKDLGDERRVEAIATCIGSQHHEMTRKLLADPTVLDALDTDSNFLSPKAHLPNVLVLSVDLCQPKFLLHLLNRLVNNNWLEQETAMALLEHERKLEKDIYDQSVQQVLRNRTQPVPPTSRLSRVVQSAFSKLWKRRR